MATCSIGWALGLVAILFVAKRLLFHRHRHRRLGRSLRWLFARLDTTPGQEREIRAALEELRTRARAGRDTLRAGREGLARALRSDVLDDDALAELKTRADALGQEMQHAFEAALRRVHAILDPAQRDRLADVLAKGWRPWPTSPYRG